MKLFTMLLSIQLLTHLQSPSNGGNLRNFLFCFTDIYSALKSVETKEKAKFPIVFDSFTFSFQKPGFGRNPNVHKRKVWLGASQM